MNRASALYHCRVTHRRKGRVQHRFRYRVFSLLLDIDELPALARRLRLFSWNRGNLFAFHDRDHGTGRGAARDWVIGELKRRGIVLQTPRISVFCFPRVLGYAFNPLSVWLCCDGGTLRAVIYEVHNTFGERHAYVIPTAPAREGRGSDPQTCPKAFYVSPFLSMGGGYTFRMRADGERLSVLIQMRAHDGDVLTASLTGACAPLSDRTLAASLLRYPMMTWKVIVGIHWEALRLWCKGAKIHRRKQRRSLASSTEPRLRA